MSIRSQVAICLAAFAVSGCGTDSDELAADAEKPAEVSEQLVAAYVLGDAEAACATLTEAGRESVAVEGGAGTCQEAFESQPTVLPGKEVAILNAFEYEIVSETESEARVEVSRPGAETIAFRSSH